MQGKISDHYVKRLIQSKIYLTIQILIVTRILKNFIYN